LGQHQLIVKLHAAELQCRRLSIAFEGELHNDAATAVLPLLVLNTKRKDPPPPGAGVTGSLEQVAKDVHSWGAT